MAESSYQILLIEEEPVLREITAFRLELLGYQVFATVSPHEANVKLLSELPQLIVLGNSAESDSLEFLNHLSNDPRTSQIPVIYLSSSSDLDDVQKAYNAGADEFLVAPYDPHVLEEKVQGLFSATI